MELYYESAGNRNESNNLLSNQLNNCSVLWATALALVLLNTLNPECIPNVAGILVSTGDLLATGVVPSCLDNNCQCNNRCR